MTIWYPTVPYTRARNMAWDMAIGSPVPANTTGMGGQWTTLAPGCAGPAAYFTGEDWRELAFAVLYRFDTEERWDRPSTRVTRIGGPT